VGRLTFDNLADELTQLTINAMDKILGAEEIVAVPGCSTRAADIAYNAVADAVNLLTKAMLRKHGRVISHDDKAKNLLKDVFGMLNRTHINAGSYDDLVTIILNRNGSVHEGAASASEIESVRAAITAAQTYAAAVRPQIGA
jgi:hypothetical protein